MLFINCSNREKNCYNILNSIKTDDDKLISLAHKRIDFCLGCQSCEKDLPRHCVLNDYITNNVYEEILKEDKIVLASPMYISNINGILKNLLDRFNTFYNHKLLKGKKIYLIMCGFATKEDNQEEINGIINYFNSITDYMLFDFEFLDYFVDSTDPMVIEENNNKIKMIQEKLNKAL